MRINTIYNGINVDVTLDNKVYKLVGDSGIGKTLLMQVINCYCSDNNISHILINYNMVELTKEKIINLCKDIDIVMLDNADLYITAEIIKEISKMAKYILISIKESSRLFAIRTVDAFVRYDNQKLTIRTRKQHKNQIGKDDRNYAECIFTQG